MPSPRKNVDTIKGLLAGNLVDGHHSEICGPYSTADIDSAIRRSEVELPHYELKQGILRLDNTRAEDPDILTRVVNTICAIANNGKGRSGTTIIGVANKKADARRIKKLDGIEPRKVGLHYVVEVKREAATLGQKPENYFTKWEKRHP